MPSWKAGRSRSSTTATCSATSPTSTTSSKARSRVLDQPAPYVIYNIGNHRPVQLLDYIAALERVLGKKAKIEMKPMQPGDVKATYADTQALARAVGFAPRRRSTRGWRSSPSGSSPTMATRKFAAFATALCLVGCAAVNPYPLAWNHFIHRLPPIASCFKAAIPTSRVERSR